MKSSSSYHFSHATNQITPSFIRNILKLTQQPDIISFAGGLPNPNTFPVNDLKKSAQAVLENSGQTALQYTTTPGFPPLREWIVKRYQKTVNLKTTPDNILITTGSQQALDLIAKVFLNPHDPIVVEDPSYLGALQAFAYYQPTIYPVSLAIDGLDLDQLKKQLKRHTPKLVYTVPTFHNPTGISYSPQKRRALAKLIDGTATVLIEDDPYFEITFTGQHLLPVKKYLPHQSIHLGSFSKSVAPGLRLGWICAPKPIIAKLTMLKEATDLHSDHFTQQLLHHYLTHNDFDRHLVRVNRRYAHQKQIMLDSITDHFPSTITSTNPQGGMFLWLGLSTRQSTSKLFNLALEQKVAFVPGKYFYPKLDDDSHLRLNFSNTNPDFIRKGIQRLGQTLNLLKN